tara:strand:+ start:952 stop:1542 length:591 start_codon:yes stop_codon:yes gene_type:complete
MIFQKKDWDDIKIWFKNNFDDDSSIIWLVDIDDTLIECSTYIGSSRWFDEQISRSTMKDCVIHRWVEMAPSLEFEKCGNVDPNFINELHGEVIAITSRHCAIQELSFKHLYENGFYKIENIVSCGNVPKYEMVQKYIQPSDSKTYIFVDDKKSHILKMHEHFPNMMCIWLNTNPIEKKSCFRLMCCGAKKSRKFWT